MLQRLLFAVVLNKPGSMLLMLVAKVIIQLMLFSLFLYMYGLPASVGMNQRATIVIKSKVDNDGIIHNCSERPDYRTELEDGKEDFK